jgi:hypothetical protein
MADLNIDADRGFIPQCCTYRGLMDLVSLIDALLYFLRSIDALGVIPSHPEEIGSGSRYEAQDFEIKRRSSTNRS